MPGASSDGEEMLLLRGVLAETLLAAGRVAKEQECEDLHLALTVLADRVISSPASTMLELSAETEYLFQLLIKAVRR